MHGLKPDIQSNLGALEDGAYGDGELIGAGTALVDARARRFALKLVVTADDTAMRADNAIGPAKRLKVLARLVCVLELGLVEDRFGHVVLSV